MSPYLNDSSIVVFLDETKIEDIRNILKDICQRFQYKLELIFRDGPGNKLCFEIDPEKLGLCENTNLFTYCNLIIDNVNKHYLEESLHEDKISNVFYNEHVDDAHKLLELFIPPEDHNMEFFHFEFEKLALSDINHHSVTINYRPCLNKSDSNGLSLSASRENRFNEYPIIGKVYMTNPDRYTFYSTDGEKPLDFEYWLKLKKDNNENMFEEALEKEFQPAP